MRPAEYLEDRDLPDPSKGNLCLEESLPPNSGILTDTARFPHFRLSQDALHCPNWGVAYYQTSRRSAQCRFLNPYQVNRENLPNAVSGVVMQQSQCACQIVRCDSGTLEVVKAHARPSPVTANIAGLENSGGVF